MKRFDGAEIDLDKSEYFGRTDFELEVEYTDEASAQAVIFEIEQHVTLGPEGSGYWKNPQVSCRVPEKSQISKSRSEYSGIIYCSESFFSPAAE